MCVSAMAPQTEELGIKDSSNAETTIFGLRSYSSGGRFIAHAWL
jgi:hypothetical protein